MRVKPSLSAYARSEWCCLKRRGKNGFAVWSDAPTKARSIRIKQQAIAIFWRIQHTNIYTRWTYIQPIPAKRSMPKIAIAFSHVPLFYSAGANFSYSVVRWEHCCKASYEFDCLMSVWACSHSIYGLLLLQCISVWMFSQQMQRTQIINHYIAGYLSTFLNITFCHNKTRIYLYLKIFILYSAFIRCLFMYVYRSTRWAKKQS